MRCQLLKPWSSFALFPDNLSYPYDPCSSDYATVYLNRPDVIAAIHANPVSRSDSRQKSFLLLTD